MTDRTHPAYAILGGTLHRQDIPGGDWTMLDGRESARLLALLAGIHVPDRMLVAVDPGGCAPPVWVERDPV